MWPSSLMHRKPAHNSSTASSPKFGQMGTDEHLWRIGSSTSWVLKSLSQDQNKPGSDDRQTVLYVRNTNSSWRRWQKHRHGIKHTQKCNQTHIHPRRCSSEWQKSRCVWMYGNPVPFDPTKHWDSERILQYMRSWRSISNGRTTNWGNWKTWCPDCGWWITGLTGKSLLEQCWQGESCEVAWVSLLCRGLFKLVYFPNTNARPGISGWEAKSDVPDVWFVQTGSMSDVLKGTSICRSLAVHHPWFSLHSLLQ